MIACGTLVTQARVAWFEQIRSFGCGRPAGVSKAGKHSSGSDRVYLGIMADDWMPSVGMLSHERCTTWRTHGWLLFAAC